MPASDGWRFGPYLADQIRDSGLSQRKVAQRAGISEGRVRQLIDGYSKSHGVKTPVQTTHATIAALSRALGFPLRKGLELAGLEVPESLPDESMAACSVEQILAELGRRWAQVDPSIEPAAAPSAPTRPMSMAELRARSQTITRLDALAREVREAGDENGADRIAALSVSLNRELEFADATEVRGSRRRRAPRGE